MGKEIRGAELKKVKRNSRYQGAFYGSGVRDEPRCNAYPKTQVRLSCEHDRET
jgi:hypothetical protein